MHIASHFCVAKVLGDFQQINMLQLTGPIHSAVVCSPGRLSFPQVQRIPQWRTAQTCQVSHQSKFSLDCTL